MIKPGVRSSRCSYTRVYTSPCGGCIDEHSYTNGHDRADNTQAATILAGKGYHIRLLPELYPGELFLRDKYLMDVSGKKNPNARVNGRWLADFKKPLPDTPIRKATFLRTPDISICTGPKNKHGKYFYKVFAVPRGFEPRSKAMQI